MTKNRHHHALADAADLGLLYYGQVKPLEEFLERREQKERAARFNGTSFMMYFIGLMVIALCTLLSTLAMEKWGKNVLLDLALLYLAVSLLTATWFDHRHYGFLTNFFAAVCVLMTPLCVFALENVLGFWRDSPGTYLFQIHTSLDWRWVSMEVSLLLSACFVFWRFKRRFLEVLIGSALLLIVLDVAPLFLFSMHIANDLAWLWATRFVIALFVGLTCLACAFWLDLRSVSEIDEAFWLYFFGLVVSCLALGAWVFAPQSWVGAVSWWMRGFYLVFHLLLMLASAALQRRSFAVFGGIGIALMLIQMAWLMFKDVIASSVALTAFAAAYMALAFWWAHNEYRISPFLRSLLPETMQNNLVWREM